MRKYELAIVLPPEFKTEEKEKFLEQIKKEIEEAKGKVIKVDDLGKKELAYAIKKAKEGFYVVMKTELPEETISLLEKKLRLNDNVLRFLLVREEK